jgi:predicted nuclease of predicted toxin-antitoxin system
MVDLCVLRGAPPKVLWLRIGNCTSEEVRTLLSRNDARIREFEAQDRVALSLFRLMPA